MTVRLKLNVPGSETPDLGRFFARGTPLNNAKMFEYV